MRIKKDDTVIVLAGKDKGKTGKVLKAFPKKGRVLTFRQNIRSRLRRKLLRSSIRKVLSMFLTLCTMTQRQNSRAESVTK